MTTRGPSRRAGPGAAGPGFAFRRAAPPHHSPPSPAPPLRPIARGRARPATAGAEREGAPVCGADYLMLLSASESSHSARAGGRVPGERETVAAGVCRRRRSAVAAGRQAESAEYAGWPRDSRREVAAEMGEARVGQLEQYRMIVFNWGRERGSNDLEP